MRYVSIDALRTVAIVLMVLVHFMENLSGSDWAPAGLGAPLFTFLVGVSYRLWLDSQEAKGVSEAEVSKITVRRGLFLFGLGFAFNVLVWLPEDTYNWDVLTLIGTAILVLNAVRGLPLPIAALFGAAAFAMAPVLQAVADYQSYWGNGYFECDPTLADVIFGFFAVGYFPFFPWILYPLAGFVTASLVLAGPDRAAAPTTKVALFGAALVAGAALAQLARPYAPEPVTAHLLTGWTMFPPSLEYVTGTLGIVLLSFAAARRWIDGNPRVADNRAVRAAFTTLSKYSLSVYLLHHVVHLWPLWIYGAATGDEPTQYWRAAMPVEIAISLAVLFLVCSFFLFRWMDRHEKHGVEGWMRRVCG